MNKFTNIIFEPNLKILLVFANKITIISHPSAGFFAYQLLNKSSLEENTFQNGRTNKDFLVIKRSTPNSPLPVSPFDGVNFWYIFDFVHYGCQI